ncbi:hypothetical protein SERLA73DRAFT_191641 [Serpula lacrymans var. lacrymans S7.3]|uniref:Uncharacterized protein n=2 Tax=Serpula lacrymans var. lacrymans TaxID=341189 RepID=F8QI03_SERL3|nr:uncharacterized protein SERLADRAFT_459633 [Serpula lacrymans var. lacrymans S7.9]EGN92066.1 hypothetical protein SERLA73DRAFT_191641 [Serpula lacrymans var. lacrymans S7.3]EGO28814.1 hypothetical protein SERLADRAFT_459633 [Serpula lacrymans var. lacrymans S7.9]
MSVTGNNMPKAIKANLGNSRRKAGRSIGTSEFSLGTAVLYTWTGRGDRIIHRHLIHWQDYRNTYRSSIWR